MLVPSVECRDIDGRVWIGFRGVGSLSVLLYFDLMGVDDYQDANPKSRRYATIRTYAFKGSFTSTGWEEGLEKSKEGTAAAVDKVKTAADKKASGPIDRAPCNCIRCALEMPGCSGSMTRSASGTTISNTKTSTPQAAEATTAIDRKALGRVSPQVLACMPHDTSHGEKDTVPAIDAGSGEIAEVAESMISTDQGVAEYQVGEEWNLVDLGEEDEEWTKV